jgi:hypothetical protein
MSIVGALTGQNTGDIIFQVGHLRRRGTIGLVRQKNVLFSRAHLSAKPAGEESSPVVSQF